MPPMLGPGHAADRSSRSVRRPIGARRTIWDSKANNHNAMFDKNGRVWLAAAVRGSHNPDFCKKGQHPSVRQAVPAEGDASRTVDPRSEDRKYTFVDLCFTTHHRAVRL